MYKFRWRIAALLVIVLSVFLFIHLKVYFHDVNFLALQIGAADTHTSKTFDLPEKTRSQTRSIVNESGLEYFGNTKTQVTNKNVGAINADLLHQQLTVKSNRFVRKTFDRNVVMEYPEDWEAADGFQATVLDQFPYVSKTDKNKYNFDRAMTQLHIMELVNKTLSKQKNLKPKIVYMNHNDPWDGIDFSKCPVTNCIKSLDLSSASKADAILYVNTGKLPIVPEITRRHPDQVWIIFINECPTRSWNMRNYHDWFNWTVTYRYDATIVNPYFRFNFSTPEVKNIIVKNYASGRTKTVAWFVSNCHFTKSGRMDYVKELEKHISVDIFGRCGTKNCDGDCGVMLREKYKFYLSFENHKCKEYITEKAHRPFENDVIPVVMGARREEYERILPNHSFIHVDDFSSPKELAEYLLKLDKNDDLYNEYFKWKEYTGNLFYPLTWCRMCSMLNQPNIPRMWYNTMDEHWRHHTCIGRQSWKNVTSYEELFIGQPNYRPNG